MQVVVKLNPLRKLRSSLSKRAPDKVLTVWGAMYRSWAQQRFNKFSRGGGNWAPLKLRKGSILRDTNTLFSVLNTAYAGQPGQYERKEHNAWAVSVGYGGSARHPGGKNSRVTIADIASFHNAGLGVPKRLIIAEPTAEWKQQAARKANQILAKIGNG